MKTRILWSLLMLGLAMSAGAEDQKSPVKQSPLSGATPSQIGLSFPHTYKISPEQKQMRNPVRFTDLSAERGRKLFANHCANCHGNNGDGKGDLVRVFNIHPPDFTKSAVLDKRTDGELFAIIGQGSENMPSHRARLMEKQGWDIVNFLRLLEGKIPAKATPDERQDKQAAAVSLSILRLRSGRVFD
jgi:cytochrome c553